MNTVSLAAVVRGMAALHYMYMYTYITKNHLLGIAPEQLSWKIVIIHLRLFFGNTQLITGHPIGHNHHLIHNVYPRPSSTFILYS